MGLILTLKFEDGSIKHYHGKYNVIQALDLITKEDKKHGYYWLEAIKSTEEFLKKERTKKKGGV